MFMFRFVLVAAIAVFLSIAPVHAKSGELFKDCDVCPEMIVLPTGTAQIGATAGDADAQPDEGPAFIREVPDPLAMGIYEVTNAQYAAFVLETNYQTAKNCRTYEFGSRQFMPGRWWGAPGYRPQPDHPVVCLQWVDVVAYLTWLREKTNQPYRLPTEVEWEYAARAGSDTRFWYGDDPDYALLCKYGNTDAARRRSGDNSPAACSDGYRATAPVGQFPPNPFGLHDMDGNVTEWTTDCYVEVDPYNPKTVIERDEGASCERRSLRGGSWIYTGPYARTANRGTHRFYTQNADVGFRVVRPYEVFVSAVD